MGGGGTISAMISSLKANNRLRRSKRSHNKFSKKSEFDVSTFQVLSQKENRLIVEENKLILKKKTKNKRILGLIMILLYGTIAIYGLMIYLNW